MKKRVFQIFPAMALVFILTALGCKQSDGKAAKTSAGYRSAQGTNHA